MAENSVFAVSPDFKWSKTATLTPLEGLIKQHRDKEKAANDYIQNIS